MSQRIRGIAAFWYGFVVGDDWRGAVVVAVALAVTAVLVTAGVNAWWLLPAGTFAALGWSLGRRGALAAAPAKKGRRAGLPVRYRDLSLARARRLILAAVRTGNTSYQALTSRIAGYRTVTDRNRHRARKSKSPSTFGHASQKDTVTRIAPAVITMANNPA